MKESIENLLIRVAGPIARGGEKKGGEKKGGEKGGEKKGGREEGGREEGGREEGGREEGGRGEEGGEKKGGDKEGGDKEGREKGGREKGGREKGGGERGEERERGREKGGREKGGRAKGGREKEGENREKERTRAADPGCIVFYVYLKNAMDYGPSSLSATRGALNLRDDHGQAINIATGLRAETAREVSSGQDVYEYQAVKGAAGRLDYWTRCLDACRRKARGARLEIRNDNLLEVVTRAIIAARLSVLTSQHRASSKYAAPYSAVQTAIALNLLAFHQGDQDSILGRVTLNFRMPLVGRFSRGYPVSPTPSFRCHSILISITLVGSQDLHVTMDVFDGHCTSRLFAREKQVCPISAFILLPLSAISILPAGKEPQVCRVEKPTKKMVEDEKIKKAGRNRNAPPPPPGKEWTEDDRCGREIERAAERNARAKQAAVLRAPATRPAPRRLFTFHEVEATKPGRNRAKASEHRAPRGCCGNLPHDCVHHYLKAVHDKCRCITAAILDDVTPKPPAPTFLTNGNYLGSSHRTDDQTVVESKLHAEMLPTKKIPNTPGGHHFNSPPRCSATLQATSEPTHTKIATSIQVLLAAKGRISHTVGCVKKETGGRENGDWKEYEKTPKGIEQASQDECKRMKRLEVMIQQEGKNKIPRVQLEIHYGCHSRSFSMTSRHRSQQQRLSRVSTPPPNTTTCNAGVPLAAPPPNTTTCNAGVPLAAPVDLSYALQEKHVEVP
ncbi:hypothetical protein PR048_010229 [Dryococelus australis]|uniref:Uncharacterized protein n=1 Tax=Dryococelus australis TaxID=614101 RepID=A0ABQ9I243_9NEOP|nr:hypothetical protein PR048_010229 [Dryococelus australis]